MANFSDLLGKTLIDIRCVLDGVEADFITNNGEFYQLYHAQDCCESVYILDVAGDLTDLLDSPILQAEESSEVDPDPQFNESGTWTFYKLATIKGSVTIRWYGSSNGYYSESVDFKQVN